MAMNGTKIPKFSLHFILVPNFLILLLVFFCDPNWDSWRWKRSPYLGCSFLSSNFSVRIFSQSEIKVKELSKYQLWWKSLFMNSDVELYCFPALNSVGIAVQLQNFSISPSGDENWMYFPQWGMWSAVNKCATYVTDIELLFQNYQFQENYCFKIIKGLGKSRNLEKLTLAAFILPLLIKSDEMDWKVKEIRVFVQS